MEPEVTQEAPASEPAAVPEATPELQSQELGTPEPTASPASGQLFTVKVDGEEIQVPLEEALNGYMRQADYTRKTQEVAAQREELSYAERIATALETDPEGAVRALVAAYELDLGQPQPKAQATPAEPAEPLDPQEAWQQRVDSFIAAQEQRAFEAQVRAELAEMHNQFGDFDDQAVIQYAVEHNIPTVTEATKAFVVDRVLATANRQVAERKAQAAKGALPPVAGGHGVAGGTVTAGGTTPADSIEAAFALAEQSLGVTL